MRRVPGRSAAVAAGLAAFFLTGFLAAEAFGVPWLSAPPALSEQARPVAAVVGAGLLVADAVLPVPSSLVMLALGGVFGLAGGAAIALTGRIGGVLLGFAIGRRLPCPPPGDRSARLLRRWGAFAIVLTRPVPIVSETVAVMAGASAMTWGRATAAAAAGSLPEAVLFAWAGAGAGGSGAGAVIWLALIAVAVGMWGAGHLADRRRARDGPPSAGGVPAVGSS